MKKIPTLFIRDENDRRYVRGFVNPGCEWVLEGEGRATRKYDGTCTLFDGHDWWARREVKRGKAHPPNFVEVDYDPTTGKTTGWEPMVQSPFARFHAEALTAFHGGPATYELVGPKINGSPDGFDAHVLWAPWLGSPVRSRGTSYRASGLRRTARLAARPHGLGGHRLAPRGWPHGEAQGPRLREA